MNSDELAAATYDQMKEDEQVLKVYTVVSYEYDESWTKGIFSTKEKALEYRNQQSEDCTIYEVTLDDPSSDELVELRGCLFDLNMQNEKDNRSNPVRSQLTREEILTFFSKDGIELIANRPDYIMGIRKHSENDEYFNAKAIKWEFGKMEYVPSNPDPEQTKRDERRKLIELQEMNKLSDLMVKEHAEKSQKSTDFFGP